MKVFVCGPAATGANDERDHGRYLPHARCTRPYPVQITKPLACRPPQQRLEGVVKRPVLRLIVRHRHRRVGVLVKPHVDLRPPRVTELLIDIGLQFGFVWPWSVSAHVTFRSLALSSSSSISRSLRRARDNRDITVPTGTPAICAASS